MRWYPPYVSVGQRRLQAAKAAKKLAAQGRLLAPIKIEGRKIASTFWGKAWCENLEAYSDYASRIPRGRTYVRNGSVIDLQISGGKVEALVQGSSLYTVKISIEPLNGKRWNAFKSWSNGRIVNQLDLLQGRLSDEMLAQITCEHSGLFPAPKEIKLRCSCPDGAVMCKHVAAVLYGIGSRLDTEPALFFVLRGVDFQELISAAGSSVTAPLSEKGQGDAMLDSAALSEIFGIEIDPGSAPVTSAVGKEPVKRRGRPAGKRKKAVRKISKGSAAKKRMGRK